jgi:hypothetical protein
MLFSKSAFFLAASSALSLPYVASLMSSLHLASVASASFMASEQALSRFPILQRKLKEPND